jgi:ABC-2 type transport system permease protein
MSGRRQRWPSVAVSASARRTVRDPGALVVSLGFYVIVSSIVATLWRAAAHANGGMVAGYTGKQLTWYIVVSEASTVALNIRMIELIGDDIASGAVATEMLRPASVLGVRVASELGRALPRLAACFGTGIVLAWVMAGPPPRAETLVVVVPSLVLAVLCNLCAQHACAGAAFWVRDAKTSWFLYQKFVFMLGGMLLPLQVLPPPMRAVAISLPFPAMAYAPARLASGHLELGLLGLQLFWLVVLAVVARMVFAAGERRLQVVGG